VAFFGYNDMEWNRRIVMRKNDTVRARIDSQVKQQAEVVFERLGLSTSEAINLFIVQVALHDGLPFDLRVPEDDLEYRKRKEALFEEWKRDLNEKLEQGEADIVAGRVLTPEQSRARSHEFIDQLERKLEQRKKLEQNQGLSFS
jgi:addiction module RelB/DinJ family antitoxin